MIMRFKCEFSVYTDFPCLADEIAEPRPDMNIKVATFTVSEKSIKTNYLLTLITLNSFMCYTYP